MAPCRTRSRLSRARPPPAAGWHPCRVGLHRDLTLAGLVLVRISYLVLENVALVLSTIPSSYLVRRDRPAGRREAHEHEDTGMSATRPHRRPAHDAGDRAGRVRLGRRPAPRRDRPPRVRRQRGARAGARGRPRPRHVAPDDRQALPERLGHRACAGRRTRFRPRRRRHGRRRRLGGHQVRRRRRGVRDRAAARSPSTRSAREDKLARKPANLTFEQAAVVPVSGITALRAVPDVGRVQAGQRVLVIGASGGVGTTRCRSPRRSGRRSPVSPAPRSSTWCAPSAPTTSRLHASTTSPTARTATT